MAAPADAELVAKIQSGDTDSEAALFERYSARVYYIALRDTRSRQDAEDVRSETFLRVLQAIRGHQVRSPEALSGFILGTTRNVLKELFLRRKRSGTQEPPEAADAAVPSHEQNFLDMEVKSAIAHTIERLRPREKALLRMHFYEELPTPEIARRTGIAPERVRLVKSRALKRFREFYARVARTHAAKKLDTAGRERITSL